MMDGIQSRRPSRAGSFLMLAALAVAGCGGTDSGGGGGGGTGPATDGSIRVTTSTTGAELDPDGYSLSAGTNGASIGINDNATFAGLTPGNYQVGITGVAPNCQVAGSNPRTVAVQAGVTAETTFAVACQATGSLQVTAVTTGVDLDVDGYSVMAGGTTRLVPANGNVTISGLPAGPVTVELGLIASNCQVSGANPRTVSIPSGSTIGTTFQVACVAAPWAPRTDMPTARLGLASAEAGGLVYAIGGYQQANGPALPTVESYDPSTDRWTVRAPMPTPRRWLTAVAANGLIYVIGGQLGAAGSSGSSIVEEYDPASNSWTRKSDMPTSRYAMSAAVAGGKIYVVGGTPDGSTIIGTLEEYDPVADTWATLAPMAEGRALVAFQAVMGKLYAIGGGPTPGNGTSTVEVYDPATDTWTSGASLPTARSATCSGVMNGNIYVIGGASGGMGGTIYGTTEAYDPAADAWTSGPDMPTARGGLSCGVVSGVLYAIGGALTFVPPHPGVPTVEKFDPSIP